MIHATKPEQGADSSLISFTTKTAVPPEQTHDSPHWQKVLFHYWHKAAIVLLAAHSLYDLWEGISFFIYEYPEINRLFEIHLVEASELNSLIGKSLVNFLAASIAIFFAIRLVKVKETTEHNIDLIASTVLILSTSTVQNYFVKLNLLNLILNFFAK